MKEINLNKEQQTTKFIILFLIAYMAFIAVVFCSTSFDAYWHIKVGQWIIENQTVPETGIFSYTKNEGSWISHEWLSAIMMYAVFSMAGWPGLVLLTVLSITLTILLLFNSLLKQVSANLSIIFVLLAYILLIPHIMPRPHMFILPIIVYWALTLIEANDRQVAPPFALALLMILWANLHGSFIIGLAFIIFFAFEAIYQAERLEIRIQLAKAWGILFILCLVGSILTPHGINTLLLPFHLTSQNYAISIVSEWQSPNFHLLQPLEVWLLIFLATTLTFGIKIPFFRMVFLLGLIHLSLKHVRHVELLGFLSPLVLAKPFAMQLNKPKNFTFRQLYPSTLLECSVASIVLLSFCIYLFNFKTVETEENQQIGRILMTLADEKQKLGNVLNGYGLGGNLIYHDYPVFIDSRTELYGDEFIIKHHLVENLWGGAEHVHDLIDEYNISWVIFNTDTSIIAYFETQKDWNKIYSDKYITIFVDNSITLNDSTIKELRLLHESVQTISGKNVLPNLN